MLYLIGGVPRSGKTQVQKYLLNNYKIPGISTDTLRSGFYNMPEFGINDR
jgi:adenylate kinase family enzyme